eukprot:6398955-Prymnesium_polylepis.2
MCAANAAERPTAIGLIDSFESLQNGRRTRQPSVQFDAAAQAKMSACWCLLVYRVNGGGGVECGGAWRVRRERTRVQVMEHACTPCL